MMSVSVSRLSQVSGSDLVLVDLFEEIATKLQAGEPVDLDAYAREHPEQAEHLRRLLPTIHVLADLGRSAAKGDPSVASVAAPAEVERGVLGDFRIFHEIGRGGMGIVYEAEQISLGRRVALKVLPFAAAMDPKQLQRFKNEAQAAAQLHHTNIVPVYGVGCERGVHYYAMQYIEGQTLAALIRELQRDSGRETNGPSQPPPLLSAVAKELVSGRLAPAPRPAVDGLATGPCVPLSAVAAPPSAETTPQAVAAFSTERSIKDRAYFRTAASLGVQAAEALEHAHQLGVVHRDIKPANLLVDVRGNLWITDFGLAHCQNQAGLTMSGDLVGTLRYMSPEQAFAKRVLVDHRTDVYSLGVTLYELLTLEHAFDGRDRQELLRQIAFEEPWPPRRRNKSIPAELETIVLKAMEKDPAQRYGTAQELADDLRRFLEDKPIKAKRPSLLHRAVKWVKRRPAVAGFLVASGVALLAVIGLVAGLWFNARLKERADAEQWVREHVLPKIRRHVDEKNYRAAFDLAVIAEQLISDDPTLADLRPQFTSTWSVTTDPPGADVYAKPYDQPHEDWGYLGRSPLDHVRLARGFFRWRVTKAGFTPVEGFRNPVERGIQFALDTEGSLPPGMVRVSGNANREILQGLNDFNALDLEDYLIDRYEVTNRQFKEFVDQGGYRERRFWKQPFLDDKTVVSWEDAMKRLHDQTGKPGPSAWRSGTFPAGEADYPVRGVSWYEAAAYAEFADKNLPTVPHWVRASGQQNSGAITALSNFGRSGPSPVGTYEGLGPFGTSDMAGNVKEWCWNKKAGDGGDRRFILGGAWDEPAYLFTDWDTASALDRSPANGFRCVRYFSDKIPPAALKDIPASDRDYEKETPASDELFQVYKSLYAYDKAPINARIESHEESADSVHETITFDAAYGMERIIAHLYLPRQGKPLYQAVAFFPGSNYFEQTSFPRENPPSEIAFLVRSGRAVLWPVYKGSCERWFTNQRHTWDTRTAPRDWVILCYKDLGRSLDYLQERSDIDHEKLAYYGVSRGAVAGNVHLAVDDRFKVGVFVLGGLLTNIRVLPEIDPINFVSRVRLPVLMLNGRNDPIFPLKTSQQPMYRLLGTALKDKPYKRHLTYDVSGHSVPWDELEKETLSWLDQYLGKVR